jgi:molybdenum cofactor synthesis domain-containing protein
MYKAAILTISDKCAQGEREDESGKLIPEIISHFAEVVRYEIIPDELELIKQRLINYADLLKVDLILTTGGTGFGSRDVTPEATKSIIEKEIPGIPEAMRFSCLKFTPRAMLSRATAGIRGKTLIINLPGSPKGVKESLEAVVEGIFHGLEVLAGKGH